MHANRTRRLRPLGLATAGVFAIGLSATGAAAFAPDASAATPTSPTAVVVNNTLSITGTKQADVIDVGVSATDPTSVVVHFGNGAGVDQTFAAASFDTIEVNLGAGDDQFSEDLNLLDPAVVDGGTGNDTINTSRGNDVVSGGTGSDTINTSDGDDVIVAGSGADSVDPGRGTDAVSLGAGQDSVVWNPGDGSDDIDGGAGRDTMVFNGSNANEIMNLSADGNHAVLTRDVGAITMDTTDVEVVNLAALGGADTITVNDLAGTSLAKVNVDLSSLGMGDGSLDTVIVNALAAGDQPRVRHDATGVTVTGEQPGVHIAGGEPTDRLQVNTSAGVSTTQAMTTAPQL